MTGIAHSEEKTLLSYLQVEQVSALSSSQQYVTAFNHLETLNQDKFDWSLLNDVPADSDEESGNHLRNPNLLYAGDLIRIR